MESLLTFEEAQARILAAAGTLPAEPVRVGDAAGRVLAEDVRSGVDLPPFPSSAMDGYAVRTSDLPGTLRVVGESAAGTPFAGTLEPGDAVAISTGAVVPGGADAVAPVEIVVKQDNESRSAVSWRRERASGHAAETSAPAMSSHQPARGSAPPCSPGSPPIGVASVSCARRPRVAVLATGSELVPPGELLEPGQIYESNTLMLAAALAVAGAEIVTAPAVRDDEASLREALERGLESDVLVTSGGVSVGEHDLVREVERELGVEECSGASRSSRANRSPSERAATRSSSACRAIPSRPSSEPSSS